MNFPLQFLLATSDSDDGIPSALKIIILILFVFGGLIMKIIKSIAGKSVSVDEDEEPPLPKAKEASVPAKRAGDVWKTKGTEIDYDRTQRARREALNKKLPAGTQKRAIPLQKKSTLAKKSESPAKILANSSVPAMRQFNPNAPAMRQFNPNAPEFENIVATVQTRENSHALGAVVRAEISASRDALRKAFLMSEILGAPKALRETIDPYRPL